MSWVERLYKRRGNNFHFDRDGHAFESGGISNETSADWSGLTRFAGHCRPDVQIRSENAAGGIKPFPPSAWQVNFSPGMGRRGRLCGCGARLARVATDESGSESEASRCLHKEQSKITAGTAFLSQRLGWGLNA